MAGGRGRPQGRGKGLPQSVRRQPEWDPREGRAQPDILGHLLRAAQAGLSPVIKVGVSFSKTPLSCAALNNVRKLADPYPVGRKASPEAPNSGAAETPGTPVSEAMAFRSARAGFSFQNLRGQLS